MAKRNHNHFGEADKGWKNRLLLTYEEIGIYVSIILKTSSWFYNTTFSWSISSTTKFHTLFKLPYKPENWREQGGAHNWKRRQEQSLTNARQKIATNKKGDVSNAQEKQEKKMYNPRIGEPS